MKPGFHVSKLESSPAQQRVLAYLRDCGSRGATTLEINAECQVQNVATWVSALRHNDIDIVCRYQGQSEQGAKVYRYWLAHYRASAQPTTEVA